MLYGINEVLDLYIFDKHGSFIAKLDSLKESQIYLYEQDEKEVRARLIAKDALLNLNLLKFLQNTKEEKLTDFEHYLRLKELHTITFNAKHKIKKCKLIANGIARRQDNGNDDTYLYEIPNAHIVNSFNSKTTVGDVSVYDLKVEIEPFNEDKDLFKMHLYK